MTVILKKDKILNYFRAILVFVFLVLTPSSMSNYICWIVLFPSRQSSAQGTSSKRNKEKFSMFPFSFVLSLHIYIFRIDQSLASTTCWAYNRERKRLKTKKIWSTIPPFVTRNKLCILTKYTHAHVKRCFQIIIHQ